MRAWPLALRGLLHQNSTMSERDHGATDGLHLGDAGGEEVIVESKIEIYISRMRRFKFI